MPSLFSDSWVSKMQPNQRKLRSQGQGEGTLQYRRELRIIGDCEETFGLRELRAKINAIAGFTPSKSGSQVIRLSPCADSCYGAFAVHITRKYLDSGPLADELAALTSPDSLRNHATRTKLVTLAAGVMTLGCAIPSSTMSALSLLFEDNSPPRSRLGGGHGLDWTGRSTGHS